MAVGLAAELQESLELSAQLIVGSKGIFEVKLNGAIIFSKAAVDRFPYLGEMSQLIGGPVPCPLTKEEG